MKIIKDTAKADPDSIEVMNIIMKKDALIWSVKFIIMYIIYTFNASIIKMIFKNFLLFIIIYNRVIINTILKKIEFILFYSFL